MANLSYHPLLNSKIRITFEVTSSTPTEKAITNLCEDMAAKVTQTPVASFSRPKVRPVIKL